MKNFLLSLLFISLTIISYAQNTTVVKLQDGWKFTTGDNSQYASPDFDDAQWRDIKINTWWEKQGVKDHNGFAWYRIKVVIPSSLKNRSPLHDSLIINLGKIDDFDQTFLNGYLIGTNTRNVPPQTEATDDFKNSKRSYWNVNRRYSLPIDDPRIHWDKENVIAVRVFDWDGPGGIFDDNAFIRMQLPNDYIKIETGENPFIHKENKWEKEISVSNISAAYTLNGKFEISIKTKTDGKEILHDAKTFEIKPNTSFSYKYEFPEQEQSCVVKYSVKLDNSNDTVRISEETPYILTPPVSRSAKINGASVYGVRPGRPFIYRIPASGEKPIRFDVKNLPDGLTLDKTTGIITGVIQKPGEYVVTFVAENKHGKSEKEFTIVVGDEIALTPPMGWNSWNVWGLAVDAEKVKAAADAFIKSGLTEHGWQYINIDDGWSIFGSSDEPKRTETGEIRTNEKFPNMKELGDYIHSLGLKFGIYSSPGPLTCGKYTASYKHELQDLRTFAKWGVDYLKYDLCSYRKLIPDYSRPNVIKPYKLMGDIMKQVTERDIVYSICEYGLADVWEWGAEVGGNLWRTTGDIWDDWDRMKMIGFEQTQTTPYAKPGHWNDPDMLVVGWVGWGPHLHPSKLTPDEQYTHISQWALLAAPLLIGCDLERLDDFTLNLLTNDEVIAIDQDPLGKQAEQKIVDGDIQVWMRPLADGGYAAGIFNLGSKTENYTLDFAKLGFEGKVKIRDVWRQKDLGEKSAFEVALPSHGSVLIKISK